MQDGAAAKKTRQEVLERMAALGAGLSGGQKQEFDWRCESWDSATKEEHGDMWPQAFASWMQQVLNDHEGGCLSSFSVFVHSEARRRFEGQVAALVVPGVPPP